MNKNYNLSWYQKLELNNLIITNIAYINENTLKMQQHGFDLANAINEMNRNN